MSVTMKSLLQHALQTIAKPREQARWVMNQFQWSRIDRWQALICNTVIGTILAWTWIYLNIGESYAELPPIQREVAMTILTRPIVVAMLQTSSAIIAVFCTYWIGRIFAGTGGFGNSISLIAWLSFVLNCLSVLQIMLWFLVPPLASLLGAFALVIMLVMLTNFCAELHGFKSLTMVFLILVVTFFAALFAFSLFLALIGVFVPGAV